MMKNADTAASAQPAHTDGGAARPANPASAGAPHGFPASHLGGETLEGGAMPAVIEGAIFDMDGTLLDSMPWWDNLAENYLLARGKEPNPADHELFKALTLEEAADYMRKSYGLDESTERIYSGMLNAILEPYRTTMPLKPGVARALEALADAGVRLCVATASEKELAQAALSRLGVSGLFDGIYTCPEVGVSKSAPDVFEWALRELGTPRAATVVFEDSLHAVETAHAAGFPVCAVREPANAGDEQAIRALADAWLDTFESVTRG